MTLFFKQLPKHLTLIIILMLATCTWAKGVYMTADQFLQASFPNTEPEPQVLWLDAELKEQISKILSRPYRSLRIRYWQRDNRSAWIFDEIGKERPITIGLILNGDDLPELMTLFFKQLPKRLTLIIMLMLAPCIWAKGVYMTADQFLQASFPNTEPEPQVLWLDAELKEQISKILSRPYRSLRIRYWQRDNRSAWIFDEIGKERPITIGLILNKQQIESVQILAFRESRGEEVKYPFFTDQFQGLELNEKNNLSQHIDGITGATLSVNAVKRAAKLALFLSQEVLNRQALNQEILNQQMLNQQVLDQPSQEKSSSVSAQ